MSTFITRNPGTPIDRQAFLEHCERGLKERYGDPVPQEIRDRLDYELAVIEQHELAGAFYVADKFAAEARRQNVYVAPCFGGEQSSLVAYVLGLNDIDPLAYGLTFERHFSPERYREPTVMMRLESGRQYDVASRIEDRFGKNVVEDSDWTFGEECFDRIASLCRLVEACTGRKMEPAGMPFDDEKAFALLRSGDRGVMDALYTSLHESMFGEDAERSARLMTQLSPKNLGDIMGFMTINRRGPLESGLADDYVVAVGDKTRIQSWDARLHPIMEETHGLLLYQEQIMQVSMALSGFSAGKAYKLLMAMGKKKYVVLLDLQKDWIAGAAENGYPPETAKQIWDDAQSSAKYAFNKSWAATYATLLMRFAYLKVHYPEAWKEAGLA